LIANSKRQPCGIKLILLNFNFAKQNYSTGLVLNAWNLNVWDFIRN